MVEVFKTDIHQSNVADQVRADLLAKFPACKINFDLGDCDHILRIESAVDIGRKVEEEVSKRGFYCEELY
jgi:hypothetical protein